MALEEQYLSRIVTVLRELEDLLGVQVRLQACLVDELERLRELQGDRKKLRVVS